MTNARMLELLVFNSFIPTDILGEEIIEFAGTKYSGTKITNRYIELLQEFFNSYTLEFQSN